MTTAYNFAKMRLSSFLVGVSIVSLAAALTPYSMYFLFTLFPWSATKSWETGYDCGYAKTVMFNGTGVDIFVRCAEPTAIARYAVKNCS